MENKEVGFLFNIEGHMLLKDKKASLDDIKELETKLIDFLNENNYQFIGWSDYEEEE